MAIETLVGGILFGAWVIQKGRSVREAGIQKPPRDTDLAHCPVFYLPCGGMRGTIISRLAVQASHGITTSRQSPGAWWSGLPARRFRENPWTIRTQARNLLRSHWAN